MKRINYPSYEDFNKLSKRASASYESLKPAITDIFKAVAYEGDKALLRFTEMFDGCAPQALAIDISQAQFEIDNDLKDAIKVAAINITNFHKSQIKVEEAVTTTKGINCWRKSVGIQKVGLYIPGGSAPLFSTLLMLAIPAKLAGCKEIVLCTPPDKSGNLNPVIGYVAQFLGLETIYLVGGAQAIAAMTVGTETIPSVYKIFGPGNAYVTCAKQLAQERGLAIDMPAGPSEVLVIADETCVPAYVAADLLSQAEHGPDSQVILVSTSEEVLASVETEVNKQLAALPRQEIAQKALEASLSILVKDLDQAMDFSNTYAPEHLILAVKDARERSEDVINAGSVFIGNYACESAGDYASGTNHTLPTNGFANAYSGVSIDSYVKKITFQEITKEGIQELGPTIMTMAKAEYLEAHSRAVEFRLKDL